MKPRVKHVVYLHGFASSPASSKAQRFARELAGRGVGFSCPDLNLPAFETLTVTRMLGQVEAIVEAVSGEPIAIVGSSLGGFVALHAAAAPWARSRVDRVILLAPAVDFGANRLRQFGDHGIEEWRRLGRIPMFHYGLNREEPIGFGLYEDAARYDAFSLALPVPALAFHGWNDETVDPASVRRWAEGRAGVTLQMVDDGHQLTASMDRIWEDSASFLGLSPAHRA